MTEEQAKERKAPQEKEEKMKLRGPVVGEMVYRFVTARPMPAYKLVRVETPSDAASRRFVELLCESYNGYDEPLVVVGLDESFDAGKYDNVAVFHTILNKDWWHIYCTPPRFPLAPRSVVFVRPPQLPAYATATL